MLKNFSWLRKKVCGCTQFCNIVLEVCCSKVWRKDRNWCNTIDLAVEVHGQSWVLIVGNSAPIPFRHCTFPLKKQDTQQREQDCPSISYFSCFIATKGKLCDCQFTKTNWVSVDVSKEVRLGEPKQYIDIILFFLQFMVSLFFYFLESSNFMIVLRVLFP